MSETSLGNAIRENGYALGSWINSASPIVAEIMAYAGFDFLTIDMEHSAVDLYQVQQLMQAIRAGNPACHPLVRLPSTESSLIRRCLDAGASGVIAPMVNTPEMASRVVSSAKYPPAGARGVGYARSNRYGVEFDESIAEDNDNTFVCVQIEHIEAARNLKEILEVRGVDAVMIGPYDLSASLGIAGELDHPEMVRVKEEILSVCKNSDVVPGIHVVKPSIDEALSRLEEGYRFVAFSLDITILSEMSSQAVDKIRRKWSG